MRAAPSRGRLGRQPLKASWRRWRLRLGLQSAREEDGLSAADSTHGGAETGGGRTACLGLGVLPVVVAGLGVGTVGQARPGWAQTAQGASLEPTSALWVGNKAARPRPSCALPEPRCETLSFPWRK